MSVIINSLVNVVQSVFERLEQWSINRALEQRDILRHADTFESTTSITGIAGNYTMPDGKTPDTVEKEFVRQFGKYNNAEMGEQQGDITKYTLARLRKEGKREALPEMLKYVDTLMELNPELETVELDRRNVSQVYDFVLGVTSGFNPDDISHYLNLSLEQRRSIDPRRTDVEENLGVSIPWAASPATLDKIEEQLTRRQDVDAPVVPKGADPTIDKGVATPGRHVAAVRPSPENTLQR